MDQITLVSRAVLGGSGETISALIAEKGSSHCFPMTLDKNTLYISCTKYIDEIHIPRSFSKNVHFYSVHFRQRSFQPLCTIRNEKLKIVESPRQKS